MKRLFIIILIIFTIGCTQAIKEEKLKIETAKVKYKTKSYMLYKGNEKNTIVFDYSKDTVLYSLNQRRNIKSGSTGILDKTDALALYNKSNGKTEFIDFKDRNEYVVDASFDESKAISIAVELTNQDKYNVYSNKEKIFSIEKKNNSAELIKINNELFLLNDNEFYKFSDNKFIKYDFKIDKEYKIKSSFSSNGKEISALFTKGNKSSFIILDNKKIKKEIPFDHDIINHVLTENYLSVFFKEDDINKLVVIDLKNSKKYKETFLPLESINMVKKDSFIGFRDSSEGFIYTVKKGVIVEKKLEIKNVLGVYSNYNNSVIMPYKDKNKVMELNIE